MPSAPVVVSAIFQDKKIGLAFADSINFVFGMTVFADHELLTNLEIALVQLGAVECVVPLNFSMMNKVKEITSNCGIAFNTLKASAFSEEIQSGLSKIIKNEQFCVMEQQSQALKAASGLIQYLQLLNSDSNLKAFKFIEYHPDSYLKLDETALKSLHVFDTPGLPKNSSLFSLLNQCKTKQGSRLLEQWLRQPLRCKEAIEERQDIIEAFFDNSSTRQSLRENCLRAVPDLSRILKRLSQLKANLQDIVVLYQTASKINAIVQELSSMESHRLYGKVEARYSAVFIDIKDGLEKFLEMIETMLDFPALDRHEYIVRADFDEGLQELSSQKEELLNMIEPEFDRIARKVGLEKNKKIKLERNNVHGYIFRVSRLDANSVKDDAELQILATLKSGLHFVTPHLRDCSMRYDELCQLYASKQSVIVKEIITTTLSYRSLFESLNLMIADLDVGLSLAYVSVMSASTFVRPLIGGSDLILTKARHPCVEQKVDFIANDVRFSRNSACVQLITGPNMGGKSTYIRQAALVVILAQIGCFVPCESASVPLFDALMVRVGAGDSIMRGISTFMMEMLETSSILKSATKDSFVVIDELGRGTSTSEGLGLAWGITKYIATKIGCFTFFATHFHELTVLANELPSLVSNLHVSAQIFDDKLTMLYSVKPGICDQSFGINVAELAKFPPIVVELAKVRAAELEGRPLLDCQSIEEEAQVSKAISAALESTKNLSYTEKIKHLRELAETEETPLPLKTFLTAALR